MNKKIIVALLAILLIFLAIGCVSAQETNTTQTNSENFNDLKNLIENSTDNSVINLNNDYIYENTVDFNGIEIKSSNVTIDGKGHTIDGNNTRIFNITGSNIILKNLIFANSKHEYGGAIYNTGHNVSIINSTFINNTASQKGGAIYNEMEITISNSTFVNNTSPQGDIYNDGDLNYNIETFEDLEKAINLISGTINLNSNITMTSNKFANGIVINKDIIIDCNEYTINGNNLGRIFNITKTGSLNLMDGNLINGKADIGGAIYNSGNLITMRVNLANNTATSYGGAIFNDNIASIYLSNFDSNNIINRGLSTSNEYYGGSAIYNWYNATLILSNSNIYNNLKNYKSGDLVSGAITTIGNAEISFSKFNNNSGYLGGAISAHGSLVTSYKVLTISNSEFSKNTASNGAGIYTNGTLFLINNCEFNENSGNKGAGISVDVSNQYTTGIINNTNFLNNKAQYGGAILVCEGTYQILNSTFINNTACVGGAIGLNNKGYDSTSKISECKFENNSATKTAGAIYNNKTLDIQNTEFINNTSPEGTFTNYGKINLHITTFTQLENIIKEFSGVLTLFSDVKMSKEESNKFANGIAIENDIIIDGKNLAVINANNLTRIFNITKGCNVSLLNIGLINGKSNIGGAIYNKGNLNISNSIIYNNIASEGSAIYNNEGNVVVDYNWWGTNSPNWNSLLKNINAPNVYAILNLATELEENNDCYITLSLNWNNTEIIASIPTCDIEITVGNYSEESMIDDGVFEETYHVQAGNTTITASLHDQILTSTINASKLTPKLIIYTENIIYGEDLVIIIILPEYTTGNVTTTINNINYTADIENRKAMFNIENLNSGNYTIDVKYNGDENYLTTNTSKNITVYKTNPNLVVDINNTTHAEEFTISAKLTGINETGLNATINVTINGKNYNVSVINGSGLLIGDKLDAGEYNFTAIWTGDENYNKTTFNGSFKVNKTTSKFNIEYNITEGLNGSVIISLASDAKGNITLSLDGAKYTCNIENGIGTIILSKLAKGTYTGIINYSGDDNYLFQTTTSNFTVLENKTSYLDTNNLIITYHDGSKFIAKLIDFNKNPIANATILIKVNNITYKRITDNEGIASLNINLKAGIYQIITEFEGNSSHNPVYANNSITIKTTIIAKDIVKMYCNDTQFIANFTDSNNKVLANTNFTFNINGVFYTKTSNENGTTQLNINLRPGNYIITSYNNITGEENSFNIIVYSLIESNDLTKYYKNESQFAVKVYDKNGNVAINKTVQFNINGIFYTKTTNNKGIASLNINLKPGNYTISTIVDKLAIGNNICVLSTLITEYLDNSKFNAKTLDKTGNPLANQSVKFNINGVFYTKITNNDGIASLDINLISGEYIITTYWRDYEIGDKITING